MYWCINVAFMPRTAAGSASRRRTSDVCRYMQKVTDIPEKKIFSSSTASCMMVMTVSCGGFDISMEYNWHANSVCRPSSRAISSLEKQSPGMSPLFFNQKIEANEEEKKRPSTAANAKRRRAKGFVESSIQRKHHVALARIAGIVFTELNRKCCWTLSRIKLVTRREYVSE